VLVDFHVPVATLLPTIVAHIGQIDTPLSPEKYILKLESTGKGKWAMADYTGAEC